jgi:hypothetical protein
MLEISEPARRLIGEAWRRGRVLVVSAPWRDYRWPASPVALWRNAGDDLLADHVRVEAGEWIYLRADLVPLLRTRRYRLDLHSIAGLWPGISVRDLDPQPVAISFDDGLWPRIRRPDG